MLIRYKRSYEKIAMGLLSFIPSEKEIKSLLQTIHTYEESSDWQLFLWKKGEDIVGEIGIHFQNDHQATIEHISVNPSFRTEGIGKEMILALKKMLGEAIELTPSATIESYFESCMKKTDDMEAGNK
jgi:riboflavin biosynthesis RibT protein